MNEEHTRHLHHDKIPNVDIRKRSRFFTIWLIPMIAAAIGGWLIYQSFLTRGIPITITFDSGEGIVADKTLIKYGGVEIGHVNSIKLSDDKNSVIVEAMLEKSAGDFAKKGSQFWVVRPRLELRGVSGLDTLITGAYIKVRPGKGGYETNFGGMDKPPFGDPDAPGLHITLESAQLGSLSEGAPVLFREIEVGRVEGNKLSKDGKKVQIHVYIYLKYATLVRKNTRFWNASGISLTAGLTGIKLRTGSLTSILSGGISFETPEGQKEKETAQNGDIFRLYDNKENAMAGGIPIKIRFITGEGLVPGRTLVKHRGLTVGKITAIDIDESLKGVIVSVLIKEAAAQLAVKGSLFWVVRPRFGSKGISGIDTLISGQYIEVRPGQGKLSLIFDGLERPPLGDPTAPGLHILLSARELGSLSEGAPIYYRKIQVGDIHGHELSEDRATVLIHLYIYEKYAFLVKSNTRFWNASGISVNAGLSGIKIKTESLMALLDGGVSFETPGDGARGKPAKNGTRFKLYEDYESAMAGGIPITITFKRGKGLEAGRTLIKYQGLVVGKVEAVELTQKMDGVIVSALINEAAADLAREGSHFWITRPNFGIDGLSELDTLLSGSYIDVQQGKGKPQKHFTGLAEPPIGAPDTPGLHIVLKTKEMGRLNFTTPLLYRDFEVGRIERIALDKDLDDVNLYVVVYEKYAPLVQDTTRFWNVGGVDVTASLSGIKVKSKPLAALLRGGISFETPDMTEQKAPCKSGTIFRLYDNYESAQAGGIQISISFDSGAGLKEDTTPVKYKGTPVGRVKTVKLNETLEGVIATVLLNETYADFAKESSKFWIVRPKLGLKGVSGLDTIMAGIYIEVLPGKGERVTSFKGVTHPPFGVNEPPLNIILLADRLGSITIGAPIYYRQIKVGEVAGYRLSESADHINIDVRVEKQYSPLVRENSKFWNASGIDISVNLLGMKVMTESVESILAGGVSFATPDNDQMGPNVESGAVFTLYDKPDSSWLSWKPTIQIGSGQINQ